MKKILYLCFFILFSTFTFAAPTINGTTGLITVPTAESLKFKEFNIAYDQLFSSENPDDLDWSYKVNLGTIENWELGFLGGRTPTEGVYINVKYYLISDNQRLPVSIAIGSQYISSLSETDIYMVASKKLRQDWGAHLGFKAIFTPEKLTPTMMGGMNYLISDQIEILGDIDGDGVFYTLNAGVRYYITPDLSLRGSILDSTGIKKEGSKYSVGISYSKFL